MSDAPDPRREQVARIACAGYSDGDAAWYVMTHSAADWTPMLEQWRKAADAVLAWHDGEMRDVREHLWLCHGHDGLYGDDGEMSCSQCVPARDFLRDPIEDCVASARAGIQATVARLTGERAIVLRECEHFGEAVFRDVQAATGTEPIFAGDEARVSHIRRQMVESLARVVRGACLACIAERDRYRAALERIDNWSRAYPLDVFPEPDFEKVRSLLEAGGVTLDAVSAANMRHVVAGAGDIARRALEDVQTGRPISDEYTAYESLGP